MKKTIIVTLALGLLIATPSCKKGDNDPALSLKSRKSRISNDWIISSIVRSSISTQVNGDQTKNDTDFDGTTITVNVAQTNGGTTTTTTNTNTTVSLAEYTINKDGTFTRVWNDKEVVRVDDIILNGYTVTTTTTQNKTTGKWSFIGKSKGDFKGKERIAFNILSTETITDVTDAYTNNAGTTTTTTDPQEVDTRTFEIGDLYDIYAIDQLKSKEVVLTQASNSTNSNAVAGTSTTTSWSTTSTMTLTAK